MKVPLLFGLFMTGGQAPPRPPLKLKKVCDCWIMIMVVLPAALPWPLLFPLPAEAVPFRADVLLLAAAEAAVPLFANAAAAVPLFDNALAAEVLLLLAAAAANVAVARADVVVLLPRAVVVVFLAAAAGAAEPFAPAPDVRFASCRS
jgi:hypothetical protein